MFKNNDKTLIIGYGNPGRLDDGLGPICVEQLENIDLNSHIEFDTDYQLTVELAEDLIDYQQVIFVDASVNGKEPFSFSKINISEGDSALNIGSHSISPEALIQLTHTLYHKSPTAWILAIRGYEFDGFGEELSEKAVYNLEQAIKFIVNKFNSNHA